MALTKFNPDLSRRDDGAYWAAARVLALRAGDTRRAEKAEKYLRRLGYSLTISDARKGVRHASK